MTINVASAITNFSQKFLPGLTFWQTGIIPRLITAILASNGDPLFARIAREVATQRRNKSTITRFFKRKRFKSRDIYRRGLVEMINAYKRSSEGIWFIVLDGVSIKRGGFTKIPNAIKYREKDPGRKGPSTKSHMLLMGAILLPNGMRLPLPRKTYYTKEYCRQTGRNHVTLVKLAVDMISEAPIPRNQTVYVLADEYFEGQTVHEICKHLGFYYIMPIDSRRCFADKQGNRIPENIHARGRRIGRSSLKKILMVSGEEDTASYRRIAKSNLFKKRVYHAYAEVRCVAGLGNVTVTYSRKMKSVNGKKSGESYRVFVSNDRSLSVMRIVEYYELRWQIELFFRELKSDLGIDHFCGSDFQAFERYVDMILLCVLFLEFYRMEIMSQHKSRRQRGDIARLRISGLIRRLRDNINMESAAFLVRLAKQRHGSADFCEYINQLLRVA